MSYHFGPFVADRASYRLLKNGVAIELTPKSLDLLFFLLERPATLVTKEALLDGVWPSANVTENALAQAISDLRDALGDRPSSPIYILTVARRGYRFVAPVEAVDDRPPTAAAVTASPTLKSIAVLDFVNVTGDPDVAWLAAGIAETVTSDLTSLDHFRVIDRWRVVQAARSSGAMHTVGAAVGAALMVTGSYQRMGPQLRITARMVDLETGEAVADAKVDGALDAVFDLQDGIVSAFAHELNVPGVPSSGRIGVRETSSLDAYRAYTEGLLKVESLDTEQVLASMTDFERAITSDSGYAMAYTGLANAKFVAFEMSRATLTPDRAALESGIENARRAIQLDDQLAEAHATLSFLLVSALAFDEARAAAHRAVALEPESWRHQYRLGHALWGSPRARAFERALALFPQFSYASFETAILYIARGDIEGAERLVRRRLEDQGRQGTPADRFPSVGFHWLLGTIEAAGRRHDAAVAEFDREAVPVTLKHLYGPEYHAEALVNRGFAQMAEGGAASALESFQQAGARIPGHLRAQIGQALALGALGRQSEAAAAWDATDAIVGALSQDAQQGRPVQHLFARAYLAAARGETAATAVHLLAFLEAVPPSHLGWTIPIEPLFAEARRTGALAPVLALLAERAR